MDIELKDSVIFPKGERAPSETFTGDVWVHMLVTDETFNCPVYNVTFGPQARTYWHAHPGGQLLLVTGGKGFYQEAGKPAQSLTEGSVVKIPPNTKHWHGAASDAWFSHVGITTNPELGDAKWSEPVSDDEYREVVQ